MGSRSNPKPFKHAGKGGGGKSSQVASFRRFGKNLLRHGPDSHGNFLWILRKGPQSEQSVLSGKNIATSRTAENCEALRKLSNYISEECATIHVGVSYLQEDIGLDFLKYMKDQGSDFLAACEFLNKKSEGEKAADQVERHVKAYLGFLQKLPDERRQQCRRLALHAARLYVLSTSFLEQAALVQFPSKWHKNVITKNQHEKAKAFVRSGDEKHLKAWIGAVAADNLKQQRDAKKAANADGTSDEAGATGSATTSSSEENGRAKGSPNRSVSSSSNGSSAGAKAKKRKDKKGEPKQKVKDRKPAEKKEKKEKKAKKDKKDKKRKASPSSSPSAAAASPKRGSMADLEDSEDSKAETVPGPTTEQTLALRTWQLSEIQSADAELQDFLALASTEVTVEAFSKLLQLVPENVRFSFGIKLKVERTRLPKNLDEVMGRLKGVFEMASQFWHAQTVPPANPES
ncbi:unnamed protein product [Symbiodinium natans]|uniref:Uncharacterized protein n=1 Tax=Symbiodinium natans TaxID=878477 RepID=A0A812QK17_9DINO|nr:unnamed protein product [Symbiodinium natans]